MPDEPSKPALAHHKAQVNGVRLHYVTAGEGDPVVLLHGWPQTCHEWRRVIPALAENHRVIAPDLRGLGDSEKPAEGYDASTLAEDIHQLLLHLGASPAHLVGHDLGGPVAYALAAIYPTEAKSLALIECPLRAWAGRSRPCRRRASRPGTSPSTPRGTSPRPSSTAESGCI